MFFFKIRMFTFCGVRKLKKIDQRDISHFSFIIILVSLFGFGGLFGFGRVFLDFGFFGNVFVIRMVTFWVVRKRKKIDQRDISLIFVFWGYFCILGGLFGFWGSYLEFRFFGQDLVNKMVII